MKVLRIQIQCMEQKKKLIKYDDEFNLNMLANICELSTITKSEDNQITKFISEPTNESEKPNIGTLEHIEDHTNNLHKIETSKKRKTKKNNLRNAIKSDTKINHIKDKIDVVKPHIEYDHISNILEKRNINKQFIEDNQNKEESAQLVNLTV